MKKNVCTSLLTGGSLLLVLNACEAENLAPMANAGPDKFVTLPGNSTMLEGSGTDLDGTVVSYQWTRESGPAAHTFTNPEAATTRVEGLVEGTYVFQLRVTDDDGRSGTDKVSVIVGTGDACEGCWDY